MCMGLPKRLGHNTQGYQGETIQVDQMLRDLSEKSIQFGWTSESLPIDNADSLLCMHRAGDENRPTLMISAGIHGDEPATTAALCDLVLNQQLPAENSYVIFPCLNPRGMRIGSRETPEGKDLNRDYLKVDAVETKTHLAKLQTFGRFDVALLLHEDWEADGFYLYELTRPDAPPRFGPSVLESVSKICPIETSSDIEGLKATHGLIHPPFHLNQRTDWPEAFFLMHHQTDHSLTLEAPSDFELSVRMAALKKAVLSAAEMLDR